MKKILLSLACLSVLASFSARAETCPDLNSSQVTIDGSHASITFPDGLHLEGDAYYLDSSISWPKKIDIKSNIDLFKFLRVLYIQTNSDPIKIDSEPGDNIVCHYGQQTIGGATYALSLSLPNNTNLPLNTISTRGSWSDITPSPLYFKVLKCSDNSTCEFTKN